jgi:benzodiazapine receptor
MGRNRFFRMLVLPAIALAMIVINSIAGASGINGIRTGSLSDQYPNFFVPAGYVFSIWGIIYIGLLAYIIWQALPKQIDNPRLQAIAPLFVLSCLANIAWLLSFHNYLFALAMLMMVALLVLLIACYLRLGTGVTPATTSETWFARVPFSIYLGWITVATVANATQWLVSMDLRGLLGIPEPYWASIMIVIASVIGLLMFLRRRDTAYLLVLAWAFAGIGVKQAAVPAVFIPAWIATVLMAALALVALFMRRPAATAPQPA